MNKIPEYYTKWVESFFIDDVYVDCIDLDLYRIVLHDESSHTSHSFVMHKNVYDRLMSKMIKVVSDESDDNDK